MCQELGKKDILKTDQQMRKALFLLQMCEIIWTKVILDGPTTEKSLIPAPNVSRIWTKVILITDNH